MRDTVPDHWPQFEGSTECRSMSLGWLRLPWVLLTLLLIPKKHGAHIAESTWTKGVFVLLCSITFASLIGLSGAILSQTQTLNFSVTETTRLKNSLANKSVLDIPKLITACAVNAVYKDAGYNSTLVIVALAIPGSYFVLAPIAPLLFMPLIAGPLSPRQRYLHCLRVFLWTSLILVPASVIAGLTMYIGEHVLYDWPSALYTNCCAAIGGLLAVWLLALIVKLGAFYRRDCVACVEEDAKPRCMFCGYIISGISLQSNCPECGVRTSESMLDRRREIPWARARFYGKPRAFWETFWAILMGKDYFRDRVIHGGRSSALSYLSVNAVIAGVFLSLCFIPLVIEVNRDLDYDYGLTSWAAGIHFCSGLLGFGLVTGIMFFSGTVALMQWTSQFCRRDPRSILIVVAYYAGNLLTMFVLIALAFAITHYVVDHNSILGRAGVHIGDTFIAFEALFIILFMLTALTIVLGTMIRLQKELRITSFAYYRSTEDVKPS